MLNKINKQYRKFNQILKKIIFKNHVLNDRQISIKKKISATGIYIGKIQDLNFLGINLKWLNHKKTIISLLNQNDIDESKNKSKGSYVASIKKIPDYILEDIYDFALDKKLVELIENYLGLGLKFRGIEVRKDINDNQNIETRIWHLDGEDSKIIKILFYLEEVDKTNGPFSFIMKNDLPKNNNFTKNKEGRISELEIIKKISPDKLNQFLSQNGDFAFVDTCSIYHKGELPISRPRYAIFFCYNSNYPIMPNYCKILQPINGRIVEKFSKKYLCI